MLMQMQHHHHHQQTEQTSAHILSKQTNIGSKVEYSTKTLPPLNTFSSHLSVESAKKVDSTTSSKKCNRK